MAKKSFNYSLVQQLQNASVIEDEDKSKNSKKIKDSKEIDLTSIKHISSEYTERKQHPRKPDGYIHPSGMGGCPRKMFFWMKKIPLTEFKPFSPETMRIFDMGHAVEKITVKSFFEQNILVAEQVPVVSEQDRVRGTLDAILRLDNKYYIVDVKSACDSQFKFSTPHKHYLYQVATYMFYTGIYRGKLYYVNKDNGADKEFDLTVHDSIFKEAQNLIRQYNRNYEENLIPDVTDIRPKCTSKSCYYYSKCMSYSEKTTFMGTETV